jgi:hypothetical protein
VNPSPISLLIAIASLAVPALSMDAAKAGAIYKCSGSDGSVAFRDKPCDTAAEQSEVSVRKTTHFDNTSPSAISAPDADSGTKPAQTEEPKDCSTWVPPPWQVNVQLPPERDYSAYPKDEEERPIIVPGVPYQVVVMRPDEHDALSVQSECAAMIDDCFHKDNDKHNSFDACFNSAPRCKSSKPWEESKPCCPDACWQKYANLRRQCVDPFSASNRVFFKDHCVPGVAELLGESKPP